MRWINIKDGIKQRLNDILGKSDGQATPNPTYWSIQAAMLENTRRVVKALVGNSDRGRVMKGCTIQATGHGRFINITSGLCLTKANGNIIVFGGVSGFDISSQPTTVYIYLKNISMEIPGATYPTIGKSVNLIGNSGSFEIVNDDSGVVDPNPENLIRMDLESTTCADNECYIGSVDSTNPTSIDDIAPTTYDGF